MLGMEIWSVSCGRSVFCFRHMDKKKLHEFWQCSEAQHGVGADAGAAPWRLGFSAFGKNVWFGFRFWMGIGVMSGPLPEPESVAGQKILKNIKHVAYFSFSVCNQFTKCQLFECNVQSDVTRSKWSSMKSLKYGFNQKSTPSFANYGLQTNVIEMLRPSFVINKRFYLANSRRWQLAFVFGSICASKPRTFCQDNLIQSRPFFTISCAHEGPTLLSGWKHSLRNASDAFAGLWTQQWWSVYLGQRDWMTHFCVRILCLMCPCSVLLVQTQTHVHHDSDGKFRVGIFPSRDAFMSRLASKQWPGLKTCGELDDVLAWQQSFPINCWRWTLSLIVKYWPTIDCNFFVLTPSITYLIWQRLVWIRLVQCKASWCLDLHRLCFGARNVWLWVFWETTEPAVAYLWRHGTQETRVHWTPVQATNLQAMLHHACEIRIARRSERKWRKQRLMIGVREAEFSTKQKSN